MNSESTHQCTASHFKHNGIYELKVKTWINALQILMLNKY